jgi:hypothetical protein
MTPSEDNLTLLANIRINEVEKYELFKTTLREAASVFGEAHLKFRGYYADQAAAFAMSAGFRKLRLYQELQETDWVAATQIMLRSVQTRSLFLYFEDHKLVSTPEHLLAVARDFERYQLDCLSYSFFRASRLQSRNLLPFEITKTENLSTVELDKNAVSLLGRISPRYYTFSLLSLVSVQYFAALLAEENIRWKLYSWWASVLATILFPYPKYRRALRTINAVLRRLGIRWCFYHPSSPFNLERMWFETLLISGRMRLGVPGSELFANCDDDNGADGESLIKRGLYPLAATVEATALAPVPFVGRTAHLTAHQHLDLTYHSAVERIRVPPGILVRVQSGKVSLRRGELEEVLLPGQERAFYANKGGELIAHVPSVVDLRIHDEAF